MKKYILLALISIMIISCGLMSTVNETTLPEEIDDNGETSAGTGSTVEENRTGGLQWSILYNPPNNPIMDVESLPNSWYALPAISSGSTMSSGDAWLFYPKSYYVDQKTVFLPSEEMKVISVNVNDGKTLWKSDLAANVIGVGNSTVVVYRSDNRIYGLDKATGQEKWKVILNSLVPEGEEIIPYPYLIKSEKSLVIPLSQTCSGNHSMTFLHIEEESGSVRLTDCRDTINTSIPIITIDGVVIAKSSYSDHYFYGLNIEDGSINWIFGDEDSAVNALFFDQEDRTLYLNVKKNANDAGDIVALHATTGKMAWTGTLAEVNSIVSDYYGYYFDGQGKFEFQNEYIIYENLRTRQEVMIFSTVNGQLLNSINSARSIWVYFADEGLISYSKDLGVLTGVDYLTGDELWSNDEITLYTFGPFNHTSIGDVVILVDDERQLIAINQTTGEKLWTKPQNELDEEQPTISYNGKLVYINDQNLIFLDPESGNTERIDIGKAATQINNTGHIEMINQSSWLLCGQFLSLVTMKE